MIHHIPNVLSKEQVAEFRKLMEEANWVGGKVTAGTLSASVKRNQQLALCLKHWGYDESRQTPFNRY
ncbi:hypothetical protein K036_4093, partial [Acinetobacter baumannii 42057_5]